MINGGLPYSYMCIREVFIFFYIPYNNPSTMYYYLSIPKEDVGKTIGWTGNLNSNN